MGVPGGERYGKSEASTIRSTPNPVHQPHTQHTRACACVGRQPDNRITGTLTHCPCSRLGGHSDRETPGPIPNPEAKPDSADGTAPARVRESRTPPSTHHNWPGTATSGSGPVTYVLVPTTHSTPPHNAGGGITKAAVPHMRPVVANRGGELGVRGWSQRGPVPPGSG